MPERTVKLFALYQGRKDDLMAVIIVPEGTQAAVIEAAWAFAVTYSAKGLNIPDYDAALVLLKKRHPSWELIGYEFTPIRLNLAKASEDIPEV